MLAAKLNIVCR